MHALDTDDLRDLLMLLQAEGSGVMMVDGPPPS
jgi:hypothetical protein